MNPRLRLLIRDWLMSLGCGAGLAVLLVTVSAAAQPSPDQPVIARVTVKTPSDLPRLMALGLDVLEMRDGDDLFILTTQNEIDRLRADGWMVRIDREQTSRLEQQVQERQRQHQERLAPRSIQPQTFMGGYRTVAEIRAFADDRAALYPNLAEAFVYGASWERLTGGPTVGHDLFGIKLTNKQRPGPKPIFFLMAAIHARELSTSELALRFVDYLLSNYAIDGDATWLLDERLVMVVPVANPDGRVLAEEGYLQRKNTDTTHGTCTVPNIGVDLNRNSSFKWGVVDGPTQSPCSQTYPGPVSVSEPETDALQTLVRSLFPDQRGPNDTDPSPSTTPGILVTLHSYSDLVLWPWGWTSAPAPNATDLSAIGRKFAAYNGYTPQQSIMLYPTSGTTDDWAYGELGIAAFTFEIGPSSGACGGFFPPFTCLDGNAGGSFWPRNLPAFLYAARIARAPFQLAHGPTAEAATATLLGDGRVELQVQLDERANGGQVIVAAEYYVDTPPWNGGTAIPMAAVDGSFDNTVEVATAVAGPFTEQHLIYVRGQDSTGAWGPVRALFTPDPNCIASLSPTSGSFGAAGGSGTVSVTIPDGCRWTAIAGATWIAVTSASGVGAGSASYSVATNTSTTPRTGTIAIAGQSFTVSEDGQPPPDLRVSLVSQPPAAAPPGTSFSVTDTTENDVAAGSAPSSTTRFYLSLNATRDAGDQLLTGSRVVPALNAGATSTGTVTVKVPSTAVLGTYFLLACADDTGTVPEGDESNNCTASGTTMRITRPDLAATTVTSPPAVATPAGNFSVTDTVKNHGAVAAAASTARYYLSADQQKGPGDTLLTGWRTVPGLAAGATSTSTVTVTIPSNTPLRSYYLLACADDTNLVVETDETNNCMPSAMPVQVTRPDLITTALSSSAGAVAPGKQLSVTDTVKNQGAVASAASTTRYYLSADQQKGAGDTLLNGRTVPGLAAGATSTGTVKLTIPSNTLLGWHYLLACADDTNLVVETDQSNNCMPSAMPVQVTRPDLITTAVSDPPPSARRGTSFSVTDTVQNQGAVASDPSTTRYYLSSDLQKGSGDTFLSGGRPVPTLAAGASASGTASVTIPSSTTVGTYYLLACADDTGAVAETNNANNCAASGNRVTVE